MEIDTKLSIVAVIFLCLPSLLIAEDIADEDIIPPEVLKQMDPQILSGARPTIKTIEQKDIFALRQKPTVDADFVTFGFDVEKLSSVQKEIIKNWIRSGHNKIYLSNGSMYYYSELCYPAVCEKVNSTQRPYQIREYFHTYELTDHKVNTDCKDVSFKHAIMQQSGNTSYHYLTVFRNLPVGSSVIARSDKSSAIAGSCRLGEGVVYFRPAVQGSDARRWHLNFWHWAMDLGVPGAASTEIAGTGGTGLIISLARKYDLLTLKNGDTIIGRIENESFTIKTSYAELTFDTNLIDKIVLEGAGKKTDVLRLKVGDRISGAIQDKTITIKLVSGVKTELDKDKVKEVLIRKIRKSIEIQKK